MYKRWSMACIATCPLLVSGTTGVTVDHTSQQMDFAPAYRTTSLGRLSCVLLSFTSSCRCTSLLRYICPGTKDTWTLCASHLYAPFCRAFFH
ncbi:hypothetical protein BD626DRAFT_514277 [Schizophyllum amplum]|uniref:Secreted protein n=1 Tax=Schizophyllum amplum TaxID=97359 RepID=A0A550BYD4_9AGAR|nr:hypothetical protein BD626DRAFT_514277 [Auriculariopsis ampla]